MLQDGFYRVARPAIHRLTRNHVWVTRGGFFDGLKVRGGLGFRDHSAPITAEQRCLANLPLAGRTVFDVGGFNGHLTWFFAQRARRVTTFEPNPTNYLRVLETVVLNELSNVQVVNAAVGAVRGTATMLASPGLDATGSLDPGIAAARREACEAIEVPVVTIDDMSRDATPDFVKVDVEGFEVEVLAGAAATVDSYHPDFQVEIHGAGQADKLAHAAAVIAWLAQRGYTCRHVESGQLVSPGMSAIAREGHVFATVYP
jgi:FkbM family methyltransferase